MLKVVQETQWQFGWTGLVAIGTLLLAAGTSFLAWVTANEARSQRRPVISTGIQTYLEVTTQSEQPLGSDGRFGATIGTVKASLMNLGPGAAFNVTVQCVAIAKKRRESTAAHSVGSVAAGDGYVFKEQGLLAGEARDGKRFPSYEISCQYEDVSGRRYQTIITYEVQETPAIGLMALPAQGGPVGATRINVQIPHVKTETVNGIWTGRASRMRRHLRAKLRRTKAHLSRQRASG